MDWFCWHNLVGSAGITGLVLVDWFCCDKWVGFAGITGLVQVGWFWRDNFNSRLPKPPCLCFNPEVLAVCLKVLVLGFISGFPVGPQVCCYNMHTERSLSMPL